MNQNFQIRKLVIRGKKSGALLTDKVHNLAMDKDYELFHLAAELKNNWRFN